MAIALPASTLASRRLLSHASRLRGWTTSRNALTMPVFGAGCAVALLAGCTICLLMPALLPWPVSSCMLVVGIWLAWRGGRLRLLGMLLAGFGFTSLHAAHALDLQLPFVLENKVLTVSGRIDDLPVHESRRTRFEFVVDDDEAQPPALRGTRLRLGWFDDDMRAREVLRAGSRWRLPLRLRAPQGLRNPGGGDGEKQALAAWITATGYVLEPSLAKPLSPPAGIAAWREQASARIARAVPSPTSRFVRALALGDTRALDDDDWVRLRAAGLTHLIAISGFHVGLVAGFFALLAAVLWWLLPGLCRWLPRPFAAGFGAVVGAFAYAAITGFALPTLRTAVMIAVLVLARCLRRHQRMPDSLALACVALLLLDPLGVLSAGFWLSFAGVAWLLWCLPADSKGGIGVMLRGFLGAQAVATLGLLPLSVVLFGQASFAGPFANLLAVPWWSLVVIPLALLGLLLDSLHAGWGDVLWQLAAWCFDLLWPLLRTVADSPLAMVWLSEPRWFALPLALLSAFWLMLPRGMPGKPLALLLWLPLLWPPHDLPRQDEVQLEVIDVGQGLSVLVRTAHHNLLYDMGPATKDGYDAGERAVVPSLHALGVHVLDAAVVSHGDNDHAGGWPAVSRAFPVLAMLAPEGSPTPGVANCLAGQSWQWDGVRFRVLHPTRWFPYLGNESTCVIRVETAHGSALLTGDMGEVIEQALLKRSAQDMRNDVVLVPHHGSAGSSSPAFIKATGARLALISSGAGNRFGHPKPGVVRRWCDAGAEVVDTARSGAVRVWLGVDGLQVQERRVSWLRLWDAARRRNGVAGLCYRPDT